MNRNNVELCPECGSTEIEDNGISTTSAHYTKHCTECGHDWMPNDEDLAVLADSQVPA